MKLNLILGIIILVFALLIAAQYKRDSLPAEYKFAAQNKDAISKMNKEPNRSSPGVGTLKPEPSAPTVEMSDIKLLLQRRLGEGSIEARTKFDAFIKEWHPVGKSSAALITAFGQPDVRNSEVITYRFDSGEGGWDYDFKIKEEVVSAVVIRGID